MWRGLIDGNAHLSVECAFVRWHAPHVVRDDAKRAAADEGGAFHVTKMAWHRPGDSTNHEQSPGPRVRL